MQTVTPTCGNQNGSIRPIITGGQSPVQISINSTPISGSTVSNVGAGNYVIKAIDLAGCADSLTVDFTSAELPEPSITLYPKPNVPDSIIVAIRIEDAKGLVLAETNDPNYIWDGMYEGRKVKSGRYRYILVTSGSAGNTELSYAVEVK